MRIQLFVCVTGSSHARVPRHPAGYRVQPQNDLPALSPRLATRRTMALEQLGQVVASGAAKAVAEKGVTGRAGTGTPALPAWLG